MILTGPQILHEIEHGTIVIDPFDKKRINPNSYNLTLHEDLLVYDEDAFLRMNYPNKFTRFKMDKTHGYLLRPGELYLGRTVERTETKEFVPMIEGRSSIGRLGIFIHITAGFGDVGFNGFWTLEISCIRPVIIFPWIEICQIFYHTTLGEKLQYKSDKYQHNTDIQPSMIYKEFERKRNEKNNPEHYSFSNYTRPD
jgi:dCTP deaminase